MSAKPTYEELEQRIQRLEHAEKELAESEEWFRRLHEASFAGIAIHDKGVILECNGGLCELSGFDYDELIGMNKIELIAPEFREKVMKNILSGYEKPYEILGIRKDGSRLPLEIREKVIPYRDRKVRVAEFRDISERKAAETELKRSHEQYRSVVENANDAIIIIQDGIIVFHNQKAEILTGLSPEEGVYPFIDFVHPEDRDSVFAQYRNKIKGNKITTPFAFRIMDKKGNVLWVDINAVNVTWKGNPAVLCFIRDITLQRKLEAQLRKSQKMESIGIMAGGIAHDFNNILSIILGNIELAMLDLPDWNPARKNLNESHKACFRARDIIRQILNFSRQTELERIPINLSGIVRESLALLRSTLPSTVEIRQNIEELSSVIVADPTQIHQVMINLCANAAYAMKGKGGVIEVGLSETILKEKTEKQYPDLPPGRYWELSVRDTGRGIDPGIIDRIFDPYFTTKQIGEGSGMGLSVVHGIVENHGGKIYVSSEPGKGSVFTILFPKIEAEAAPEKEKKQELPEGNERILFVDDEISLAKIGKRMLERLGYQVISKTNPLDALEVFKADPQQFDLVITDITMPQMTGNALTKEMIRIRPGIPIILYTGYSDEIDEKRAAAAGIRAYIMKPMNIVQLANTVRKVLDEI